MPTPPQKLRKQYTNTQYPSVTLRFEDGHEIKVQQGSTKSFDCYFGERIKILAVFDPREREKIDTLRAEQFDDATDTE